MLDFKELITISFPAAATSSSNNVSTNNLSFVTSTNITTNSSNDEKIRRVVEFKVKSISMRELLENAEINASKVDEFINLFEDIGKEILLDVFFEKGIKNIEHFCNSLKEFGMTNVLISRKFMFR
jgi:hypothetical protein